MRGLTCSRVLHPNLRQCVEAYIGCVLQSVLTRAWEAGTVRPTDMPLAIVMPCLSDRVGTIWRGDNAAHDEAFRLPRFAVTGRWGMYR